MYGLHFREELPPVVADELEALIAAMRAFLYTEHNEDGTHRVVTATHTVPIGTVAMWSSEVAPSQWILCDGRLLNRALYQQLFLIVGTTYGAGDGSTTFAVPDLRQRFPLGKSAAGLGNTLGMTGGSFNHAHTLPDHTHAIGPHAHTIPDHTHTVGDHTHTVVAHIHDMSHSHTISGVAGHQHGGATGVSSAGNDVQSGVGASRISDHSHTIGLDGAHDHGGVTSTVAGSTGASGAGVTSAAGTGTSSAGGAATTSEAAASTTGAAGGAAISGTDATMPPWFALNFIILAGV